MTIVIFIINKFLDLNMYVFSFVLEYVIIGTMILCQITIEKENINNDYLFFSNHAFASSLTAAFISSMDSMAKPRRTV